MEVKKSLKEFATVSDLDVTVSPIEMDIGVEDLLDSVEIRSRTPDHTFCTLL